MKSARGEGLRWRVWVAMCALVFTACEGSPEPMGSGEDPAAEQTAEPGEVLPVEVRMPRLTQEQYRHSVRDIFGEDIVLPSSLEPDAKLKGFTSLGAGASTISPRGVEQYEDASYEIAEQVFEEGRRERFASCAPSGPSDEACARQVLEDIGRRLWRRPLEEEELARLAALAVKIGEESGDFWTGLQYGLAAMLQSPHFLFRAEVGQGAGARRAHGDFELASKLSFLLWNTTPDDELLAAAEAGELSTEEGLRAQAERLLADPRARVGVRALFTDVLDLDELEDLNKDPTVFTQYSKELGDWSREQTLLTIEDIVFERRADFRDLMVTRRTFLNRKLASMYGVVAPSREGFAAVELPEDSERVGLLGHASVLNLHAHPVSTSATLRGRFIRERLLCQSVPNPPAGVDTSIPEPSGTALTLRDRVAEHLENPSCAGCHKLMDPLGLALEHFDGVGVWREYDNGVLIDTSGEIDGRAFEGIEDLAWELRDHPELTRCMVKHTIRYATGATVGDAHRESVNELTRRFAASNHDYQELLLDVIMSPVFREVTAPTEQEEE